MPRLTDRIAVTLIFRQKVTGELVLHLRKVCRNLKELDLSRCKSVTSASVRRLFDSCPSLESLNVSFLEGVAEEAFEVGVGLILGRFFGMVCVCARAGVCVCITLEVFIGVW